MNLAFITHADCLKHSNGAYHPENAARLEAITDMLIARGLDPWLTHLDAPLATREDLALAHSTRMIELIFEHAPIEGIGSGMVNLDGDTAMNPHTLPAALRAAGSGLAAVDWVLQQAERRAFCAIRPPGHHASRNRPAGFCIFNNVAVAALHALERHGLERVAIIDFDVHHGDGTEAIVAGDQRILFCSSFQHPYYPGSGIPPLADNCLPVGLPAGTDGTRWRAAVSEAWFARLKAFAPQLIFISAGFDAHRDDDMGQFALVEDDYVWLTQQLIRQAKLSAGGRIVSMLEGGYDPLALARSVYAHLRSLNDD
ncbi:MAG: deacetylase [Gammaproteobacteria bacterium 28-57-27]|nr:MAG: deacetylase [Gammaproteobacteria bacterium 28-57-27]